MADFETAKPKILGALFDGISVALKNQNTFELGENLRMADAWHWISAAETSFGWKRGEAIQAFKTNQDEANRIVLNGSPIASLILKIAIEGWSGTPADLLSKLNSMRSQNVFDPF